MTSLAQRAQVNGAMARLAVDDWTKRSWLEPIRRNHEVVYLIRSATPNAPSDAALDALGLLQVINGHEHKLGRLTYAYASALSFHGLTELIPDSVYVFHNDPSVTTPKLAEDRPFTRSSKTPTLWGPWRNRQVFLMRRHPNLLRPYQRVLLDYQGVRIPCTSLVKTLIDCWVRPDLSGGADRVNDAWRYLAQRPEKPDAVAGEIAAILKDSSWPAMRMAFAKWLQSEHPQYAGKL
ncbi:MAG: hypothetical protein AAB263_01565 [Planctomycetota bacterium]